MWQLQDLTNAKSLQINKIYDREVDEIYQPMKQSAAV